MDKVPNKDSFQILLLSDDVDNLSEYWQDQCQELYNSITRNLPEGSIKPLELEGTQGERVDLVTIFSTLAAFGITGDIFVNVILDSVKLWLEYRPTAEIEVKCPNGITVKITKLPFDKLSKFFEENPQLSICEGLNSFNNLEE